MNNVDLTNRFAYHPPRDDAAVAKHETVRGMCLDLALSLDALVPDGREKSLAITNLEQVMFWANGAIARA